MPIDLPAVLACPGCTYRIIDPTWFYFAAARLAVVCYVADQRLKLPRIFALFCLYESAYYFLYRLAVWYSHPIVVDDQTLRTLVELTSLVLTLGVPAAITFRIASRFTFFRLPGVPPLPWRRALLLMPFFIGLIVLEGLIIGIVGYR